MPTDRDWLHGEGVLSCVVWSTQRLFHSLDPQYNYQTLSDSQDNKKLAKIVSNSACADFMVGNFYLVPQVPAHLARKK
jgi:hypothetical protein